MRTDLAPYKPSPLSLLHERILKEITRHEAKLKVLREREKLAAVWAFEDCIWEVMRTK